MRLALFSISYAGLWGQAVLSVREFIEQAARLGFAGVMLAGKRPHLAPLDVTPAKTEEIREVLVRHRPALRGHCRLHRFCRRPSRGGPLR